ncbi:MAG TPA: YidC/Oxa1 family membrane protein insertase [Candidatus Paceibacterota bacterium]|nr:YidC/Oxa1 family membrane protein insertase [Candidatus Paceibacterota bacterium]
MFETLLVKPLYNGFIFLIGVMPGGDVGFAIIVLTLIIRVLFYPAFAASIRTQMGMQAAQAELDEINKKYKDDSTAKAQHTLALYKEKNIRPFAGFVALLVQIPVFLALYFAFFREGLPHIAENLLYSFVHVPAMVNLDFLGFVNLLEAHNIVLAVIVAGLQYLVAYFSMARTNTALAAMPKERQAAQRMQQQMMLYFLPAIMAFAAYSLPAAVGLYFAAGNVVSLAQEWVIRKQLAKKANTVGTT